jgi:hypothetical protein
MSNNIDTLRVIGSPQGFAVYDNARRKLNVMALDLFIRPGNPPLMQIAMPAGNIDVVGKSLFAVVDMATGKPRIVKRIEWADGEVTDFPEPEKVQAAMHPAPAGNGQTHAPFVVPGDQVQELKPTSEVPEPPAGA